MTQQCAKPSMASFNLEIVQKRMKNSGKMVMISAIMLILFGSIIGYSLYKIYETVSFYMERRRMFEESKKKAMTRNVTYDARNDNVAVSKNDDDVSKQQDDYRKISASINDSVKSYKEYNQKLSEYYTKTVGAEAPPDQIDKNILLSQNDNWK